MKRIYVELRLPGLADAGIEVVDHPMGDPDLSEVYRASRRQVRGRPGGYSRLLAMPATGAGARATTGLLRILAIRLAEVKGRERLAERLAIIEARKRCFAVREKVNELRGWRWSI